MRYKKPYVKDGIKIFEVDTWEDLVEIFSRVFNRRLAYAFRGQRKEEWGLVPGLTRALLDDRKFEKLDIHNARANVDRHFDRFKKAIVGRRGDNPKQLHENELWALGQHYGLKTPLLDWTMSPYVATYFAFEEEREEEEKSSRCAVWAVDTEGLEFLSRHIEQLMQKKEHLRKNRHGVDRKLVEVVSPDTDENKRLISQSGIFIKIPFGTSLEEWAVKYREGDQTARLMKFTIPNTERDKILSSLDRMNINRASLFPDLSGSAGYCNYLLEIHGAGSRNSYKKQAELYGFSVDPEDLAD